MKVTVEQIKAKIPSLPANVRDLVQIDADPKSGLAYVKSASSDATHIVHIEVHKDDPNKGTDDEITILNSTCPCDARELCWHVVAFYAVAKHLLPVAGFISKTGQEDAKEPCDDLRRLTKEAIHADLCAHEALAAMLEEIERRAR